MQKYIIGIEETIVSEFDIVADNPEDALQKAKQQYKDGVLVLSPGEVQYKQIALLDYENGNTEWQKF